MKSMRNDEKELKSFYKKYALLRDTEVHSYSYSFEASLWEYGGCRCEICISPAKPP